MTIAPTRIGSRNFSRDMKEIKHVIEGLAESVIKKVAVKTLGILVQRSPILTGRYVSSHKVVGDKMMNMPEREEQKNRRSAASTAMSRGQNTIGRMENPKSITIENTVHYAQNVETGWHFEHGAAPGYFVYTHTANDMLEETPRIIKEEEAKAKLNEL